MTWTASNYRARRAALIAEMGGVDLVVISAGTPITNSSASNGSLSTLTLTGKRLTLANVIPASQMMLATQSAPQWLFGQTQA